MPRYYFDVDSPTISAVDEFGDVLASDDLALEYAFTVLCENMRGRPSPCGTNLVVTVRDDTGPRFQAQASISVGEIDASDPFGDHTRLAGALPAVGSALGRGSVPSDADRTSIAPRDPL